MNHRIEKLSLLLNSNETHLNVEKIINEASDDNSCSSKIKVMPLSMPKSKRFKVASYNTTSSQLYIHNQIHSKKKRFACDQCSKTFSLKTNLIIHKRIHTGEKPYSCEECQKKFSDPSHLRVHKRIHTGVKPYQCDICQKKFAQSQHLTLHKRIHSGEKPYQCDLCHKKFARSDDCLLYTSDAADE